MNHPFSLAYALCHSSWLHHNFRLSTEVWQAASEGISIAKEQGFAFWLAEGLLHQGFSQLLDREVKASLGSLQSGLEIFNMTGAKLSLCHFYTIFAEAHLRSGNTTQSLRQIDEALQAAATNGSAFYLAEIHRHHGEILLAANQPDDAELCFNRSLDLARSQHAKAWELRTTTSLCRLWMKQRRRDDAHRILTTIYEWFQEGFQTPDLLDAKQLLDSLS